MSKLMMLVAAKWRHFSDMNPNLQSESAEAAPEAEYTRPQRSRGNKEKERVNIH